MCGLCGVFGDATHWSESSAHRSAFSGTLPTRRAERLARVRLANSVLRHYGLTLADWQGNAYVLKTRTGRSELIDSLGALWPAAERLAGRECDPLDAGLLARLRR